MGTKIDNILENYTISENISTLINHEAHLFKILEHNKNYDLGNQVLYDLCKTHYGNKEPEEITSKIWLIGRSYAAAVERRRNTQEVSNEEFWNNLLNAISKSDINDNLKELQNENISDENIEKILETHKILTHDIFALKEVTNLEKRSLASKYLHFHCPNLFFIYDSRASKTINNFVNKKNNRIDNEDKEYIDFYYRCLKLQNYIYTNFEKKLTPREIDTILLYYAEIFDEYNSGYKALFSESNYDIAIKHFEFVKNKVESGNIYNNLGIAYARSKRYDKAQENFTNAIKISMSDKEKEEYNYNLKNMKDSENLKSSKTLF